MRPLTTGILCVLAGLAGFGIGAWSAARYGWGSNAVTATIVNDSGRTIDRAHVEFESCNLQGSAIVGRLAAGDRRTVHFSLCGEGGYVVDVRFADGKHLRSGGGYVERGYRTLDVVQPDRIDSAQSPY